MHILHVTFDYHKIQAVFSETCVCSYKHTCCFRMALSYAGVVPDNDVTALADRYIHTISLTLDAANMALESMLSKRLCHNSMLSKRLCHKSMLINGSVTTAC